MTAVRDAREVAVRQPFHDLVEKAARRLLGHRALLDLLEELAAARTLHKNEIEVRVAAEAEAVAEDGDDVLVLKDLQDLCLLCDLVHLHPPRVDDLARQWLARRLVGRRIGLAEGALAILLGGVDRKAFKQRLGRRRFRLGRHRTLCIVRRELFNQSALAGGARVCC